MIHICAQILFVNILQKSLLTIALIIKWYSSTQNTYTYTII